MSVRRYALLTSAVSAAFVLLAACAPEEPATVPPDEVDPPDEANDVGTAAEGQAPMLAELVEAGELPPLEERLPVNPLVVEPHDRIGVYGGTWHTTLLGPADTAWLTRTVGYDQMMRWDLDFTQSIPNVAESVDAGHALPPLQ